MLYLIYIYFYVCAGSSLLCAGFLQLWQRGLLSSCSEGGYCQLPCEGYSLQWLLFASAHGLWGFQASVVVPHGFQSMDSVLVMHWPSCFLACAVFLYQGSNPCPLYWQVLSLPLDHQGNLQCFKFINSINEQYWLFIRFHGKFFLGSSLYYL